MQKNSFHSWVEIDLKAMAYNIRQIKLLSRRQRFRLPTRPEHISSKPYPVGIMAVVKADAYGHGMDEAVRTLNDQGVQSFGVSDVHEGIQLRKTVKDCSILCFESILPEDIPHLIRHQLMPTIASVQIARKCNDEARKVKKRLDVHIAIDTGMGRMGVWHEEGYDFVRKIHAFKNLRILGISTHFPAADTDRKFTKSQIKLLYDLVLKLDRTGLIIPYIHAANSMGLAGYETHVLNLSRPGLMIYGLYPHASLKSSIKLKPVMTVKAKIVFIKDVKKGRSISYGRSFFTKKDMVVATLPVGYNDGYFRAFSNKSSVLVGKNICPVVGKVTMDQTMIDVTHVKQVKVGTQVVLLGKYLNNEMSADKLADDANTINYEIVCSLGSKLPRVYKR